MKYFPVNIRHIICYFVSETVIRLRKVTRWEKVLTDLSPRALGGLGEAISRQLYVIGNITARTLTYIYIHINYTLRAVINISRSVFNKNPFSTRHNGVSHSVNVVKCSGIIMLRRHRCRSHCQGLYFRRLSMAHFENIYVSRVVD